MCAAAFTGVHRGLTVMTKSELIERIAQKQSQLAYRDVELAGKTILEHMAERVDNALRAERMPAQAIGGAESLAE